jgi:GTPase SAR1 family protein
MFSTDDFLFRPYFSLVLLGHSNSGKTHLVKQYVENIKYNSPDMKLRSLVVLRKAEQSAYQDMEQSLPSECPYRELTGLPADFND